MIAIDVAAVAENLERQELEAAYGGVTLPPQIYTQLLALYLYQNDLCNAKYLWMRIPANVKSGHPELQNVWKVGQKMWQRDFGGTYEAINEQWSSDIAEIMEKLLENVRNRALHLISTAYSSISLEALSTYTGLSGEEAVQRVTDLGWTIDTDTKVIHPSRPTTQQIPQLSCEDQLSKLTGFVSFLEN